MDEGMMEGRKERRIEVRNDNRKVEFRKQG
jgi:hypothetical protein